MAFQLQFKQNHLTVTIEYELLILVLLVFVLYLLLMVLFVAAGSWTGMFIFVTPLLFAVAVLITAIITKSHVISSSSQRSDIV